MANGNLDKFKQLVAGNDQSWLENVNWHNDNKAWLKKSAAIALAVLRRLRALGITQKDLADQLGISAQQVSKLLKGKENLTLETISKLEAVLAIELALINVPETPKADVDIQAFIKMRYPTPDGLWIFHPNKPEEAEITYSQPRQKRQIVA